MVCGDFTGSAIACSCCARRCRCQGSLDPFNPFDSDNDTCRLLLIGAIWRDHACLCSCSRTTPRRNHRVSLRPTVLRRRCLYERILMTEFVHQNRLLDLLTCFLQFACLCSLRIHLIFVLVTVPAQHALPPIRRSLVVWSLVRPPRAYLVHSLLVGNYRVNLGAITIYVLV